MEVHSSFDCKSAVLYVSSIVLWHYICIYEYNSACGTTSALTHFVRFMGYRYHYYELYICFLTGTSIPLLQAPRPSAAEAATASLFARAPKSRVEAKRSTACRGGWALALIGSQRPASSITRWAPPMTGRRHVARRTSNPVRRRLRTGHRSPDQWDDVVDWWETARKSNVPEGVKPG